MEQFIGCDAHKKFSVFVAVNEKGVSARHFGCRMIDRLTGSFWRVCPHAQRSLLRNGTLPEVWTPPSERRARRVRNAGSAVVCEVVF